MSTQEKTSMMKASLRQYHLKYLLDRAAGAVGRLAPYFLLDLYLTRMTCTASDNTIRLVSEVNLIEGEEISCGGSVCVTAAKLAAIIDALPDTFIDISSDGSKLTIECGDYSGNIPTVDPVTYFPLVPLPNRPADFTCEGDLLPSIHAACQHSLARKGANYLLEGLSLRHENDKLSGAATNGHCLALASKGDLPEGAEIFNAGIVLPPRALAEIKKITAGWLEVWKEENSLIISAPGITLVTQLLDGEYPAVRRVIPTDHPHCCVVDAAQFAKIVERVTILSESDSVILDIKGSDTGEGGDIRISTENEAGETSDLVAAEVQGEPVQIRVKPAYLVESLRSLGKTSADVLIKYNGSNSPLVLLPCDHSGWDERLEVVMPRSR